MLELLMILGGAAVVGGGFLFMKRRKKHDARAEAMAPRDRTPLTIRPGDVVSYIGTDYLVKARNLFDEEGFRWFEHELEDGSRRRVLVTCLDDRLRMYFMEPDPSLSAMIGENPSDSLEVGLVRYRMVERGAAKVTREEEGPGSPPADARYWEYSGPGGKVAWVVRRAGRTTASVGEEIRTEGLLEIYPSGEDS
jgi:LPXTG-motif cell wall-anchored protein